MSLQAQLHLISCLTFIAIINWLLADRSVMGRILEIRTNPPWVAMRWFGLGVVVASLSVGFGSVPVTTTGFAGALILLMGTARRSAGADRRPSARPPGGKHAARTGAGSSNL